MHLTPYPKAELRWLKVCKHVFDPTERWWEVYGGLDAWQSDWTTLRAAGCVHGPPDGHLRVATAPGLVELIERHHVHWFEAAKAACAEATAGGRVIATGPDTRCFVGDLGVTVYVAGAHYLKTCFRPAPLRGRGQPPEQRRRENLRAAVRRARRRASLPSHAASDDPTGGLR